MIGKRDTKLVPRLPATLDRVEPSNATLSSVSPRHVGQPGAVGGERSVLPRGDRLGEVGELGHVGLDARLVEDDKSSAGVSQIDGGIHLAQEILG